MLLRNIFVCIRAGVFSAQRLIIACGACGVLTFPATTQAEQIGIGSGLRVDRPARTMIDLRDEGLVRQRFDFSCGAAALATILRYGLGENVTERQILDELFDLLPEEEEAIRRSTGFSLLDLQRVAQARGYSAQGFRLEPDQLAMLGGIRTSPVGNRSAWIATIGSGSTSPHCPTTSGHPV